jgi:hypothetical protein
MNKSKQNSKLALETCPMFVTTMHSIPLKIDNNTFNFSTMQSDVHSSTTIALNFFP